MTRNRTKVHDTRGSGNAIHHGGIFEGLTYYAGFSPITCDRSSCFDDTHPPPFTQGGPLVLNRSSTRALDLGGTTNYNLSGTRTVQFNGCNATNRTGYQYAPTPVTVSWGYWKTLALANLSAVNPVVDVPLLLYELREFPGMLRDLGRVLSGQMRPSDIPGGHLAYEFGWAPLVSDALQLGQFARSVKNRVAYLKALDKGMRLQRRLSPPKQVVDDYVTDGYKVFTLGYSVDGEPVSALKADIWRRTWLEVWFSCRAKLNSEPNLAPTGQWRALRSAAGLTARPSLLWNAMPWTWLTDYFINVGNYIEAWEGLADLTVRDMCVMARQVCLDELYNPRLAPGLSCASSRMMTISKQRAYYPAPFPSLSLTQSFLNDRQKGILGSLVTARILRAFRG